MDPTKRKKRTPVKIPSKVAVVIPQLTVEDPKEHAYCRMLMAEKYIHDPRSYSVREIRELPEFSHIDPRTAEYWCVHDKWVERRKAYQEELRNRITKALLTEMTQERMDYLRKLVSLRVAFDNVGMIENDKGTVEFKLQPKSLEAWVTAKVKLDQHISKVQTTVAGELPQLTAEAVLPVERASNLPSSLKPRLTEEESLDLALRLRDKRMHEDEASVVRWKASQAALTEGEPQVTKKKKPPPDEK